MLGCPLIQWPLGAAAMHFFSSYSDFIPTLTSHLVKVLGLFAMVSSRAICDFSLP